MRASARAHAYLPCACAAARDTPYNVSMTARSKTWSGQLACPTEEQLEQLRTMCRDDKIATHLAIRHHRQPDGDDVQATTGEEQSTAADASLAYAEVLIVFKQPRRIRQDGSMPPFPDWTPAVFEVDWPQTKLLWKDAESAEFFPSACPCRACNGGPKVAESASGEAKAAPSQPKRDKACPRPRKRSRIEQVSGTDCTQGVAALQKELEDLRTQLAAANARWLKAQPILQNLLSPEAFQALVGDQQDQEADRHDGSTAATVEGLD